MKEAPEELNQSASNVWHCVADASGRILIPADLRNEMNVESGTPLVLERDETGISLRTYEETIRQIQAYYMAVSPPEDVWSDSLISERKREAAIENAKYEQQAIEAESE
ncbi:MAG: AbrB/MazE/SpoVT family DNA-binding domain-containing protein [Fuerstiella sp.]